MTQLTFGIPEWPLVLIAVGLLVNSAARVILWIQRRRLRDLRLENVKAILIHGMSAHGGSKKMFDVGYCRAYAELYVSVFADGDESRESGEVST